MVWRVVVGSLLLLWISCGKSQEANDQDEPFDFTASIPVENPEVLTEEQDAALGALNAIQVQGDHLYSTFAGLRHECFPPDTSFTISRDSLEQAMQQLLTTYYKDMPAHRQDSLISLAVLAQDKYFVLHCTSRVILHGSGPNHHRYGSWILPNVLARRDVVISW